MNHTFTSTSFRPELLSPAGDPERLSMAIAYGADAVYLAGHSFGMRAAAGNFSKQELADAISLAHVNNVRVYVTCNTLPREDELNALPAFLSDLQAMGADALIITDLGVLSLAKKHAPRIPIHISTQAGVVNSAAAEMFFDLGASRVVLARELSLSEIADLRAHAPRELELEAFVHGAMCVSFSGRCLLSNYMTGRDANRGACAQPCRYRYALMEEKRPGEYFPILEDGGTHILNSKDLCMLDHIPELIHAGIASFKIEGRMKSSYYTAVVTQAYRKGLDAAMSGQALAPVWREEVDKVSHRYYHTGFYFGSAEQYYPDSKYIRDWEVSAFVEECDPSGNALLSQRNRFALGDTLELVGPDFPPVSVTINEMTDGEGTPISVAPHPKMAIRLRLPAGTPKCAFLRRKTAK